MDSTQETRLELGQSNFLPRAILPYNGSANTEPTWRELLCPSLEQNLRIHCDFAEAQVKQHIDFFNDIVLPWMGSAPRKTVASDGRLILAPHYASSMTNDHTAIEYSYSWKNTESTASLVFRYIIDIAPRSSDGTRAETLRLAVDAIADLERQKSRPQFDLQVFGSAWTHVAQRFIDWETQIHPVSDCCGPSSTFVGFNLRHSGASAKVYWLLPRCQSARAVLTKLDEILLEDGAVIPRHASSLFESAWSRIREYIGLHEKMLKPRMLSMDATRFPDSRIKLYTRCMLDDPARFSRSILPHLSLGGHVDIPSDLVQSVEGLWDSLAKLPDEAEEAATSPSRRHGPRYCLLLHEIGVSGSSGHSYIRAKLYVMCGEFSHSDAAMVEQLLQSYPSLRRSKLSSQFPLDANLTGYIAEIGLAPQQDDTDVSLYLNPSLFSSFILAQKDDGTFGVERPRCCL